MAATKKAAVKKAAKKAPLKRNDAIALLIADHKRVKALFKKFETVHKKDTSAEKATLATQVCEELKVHTRLEEEIFYPAVRAALSADDLLDEAEVEHASAKELIDQLERMTPKDALFDAKVKVLGEYVDHHVKEEEGELFPKVRKAKGLDTLLLGTEMLARKPAILAEVTGASVSKRPNAPRRVVG